MGAVSIFLAIFLTFALNFAQAKTCTKYFEAKAVPSNSKNTKLLHNKLEIVENSKGNVLLIHGLGDNLTHLQKISEQLKKEGYTVLRIDLHGHGKNLEADIANHKNIPSVLPFENNVQDITKILKAYKFRHPIIIGHSYGGAIAHSLASNLKTDYKPRALVMMAPYMRRLDHSLLTGNPVLDMQTEYMTEQFMRQTYREYFESQKREHISEQVDSAIATTKGIRRFDLLSYDRVASPQNKVPLLVMAGSKDELVKEDQIQTFHKKLSSENFKHDVVVIEGDHFFPHKLSKEAFNTIRNFLSSF